MHRWQLRLLGGAELIHPQGSTALERKAAALLTYLTLEGATPRASLAGLLWPDRVERQARTNLRKLLSRLRSWPGLIDGSDPITLGAEVDVDLHGLERALADLAPLPPFEGELLAGFDYSDCPDLEEWLFLQREGLRDRHLAALERAADALTEQGRLREALELAGRMLRLQPIAETIHRRIMRLHFLLGDRAAALKAYHHGQELLERHLGVTPSPETVELARQIERLDLERPERGGINPIPLEVQRPPLVGRRAAWRTLLSARDDGKAVLIAGPAGIGKSRLAGDFAAEYGPTLRFEGRPGDRHVPYATAARAARAAFEHDFDLDPWAVREIDRIRPERPPPSGDGALHLDRAFTHLLERLGVGSVVVDDLQDVDPASAELIARLQPQRPETLYLICFRPAELGPEAHDWVVRLDDSRLGVRIDLEPLGQGDVATLLGRLGLPEGGGLAAELTRHSGGNPLYLVETLKSHYERGGDPHDLPNRAHEVLQRRVAQLPERVLQLARAIAINAGEVDIELVSALTDTPPLALSEALGVLEKAQMLEGRALSHALLTEAVLTGIPGVLRRYLHGRAAAHLGDRDPASVRAAEHWLAASEPERALQQWLAAAEALRSRGLPGEAATLLERALQQAPAAAALPEAELALAGLWLAVARYDDARGLIDRAREHEADPRVGARVKKLDANLRMLAGQLDEASAALDEGEALATHLGDEALLRELYSYRIEILYQLGRFEEVIERSQVELARLRQAPPSAALAAVLSNLGSGYRSLGRDDEAIRHHQEALHVAREIGAAEEEFQAANNLASTYAGQRRFAEALELIEVALALGHFHGRDTVRGNQAALLVELGRFDEAIHVTEALARDADQRHERTLSWARLAQLYHHTGHHKMIDTVLEQALVSAADSDEVTPKVRVTINTLRYGDPALHARADALVAEIDLATVQHDMRAELTALLEQRDRS